MAKVRQYYHFITRQHPVLGLYLVAVVLRVILALNGGELYLRDEVRIWRLPYFVYQLFLVDPQTAFQQFYIGAVPHFGYHLVNAPATLLYGLLSYIANAELDFFAPQLLAVASAPLNASHIILVYAIARRANASRRESLLAALMTLFSASLFYFSRHFIPYDNAMAFLLFGLFASLEEHSNWKHALVVGLITGFGFMVYYGYWMLAGLFLAAFVFRGFPSIKQLFVRTISGIGVVFWPAFFTLISIILGLSPFFNVMRRFSDSIVQGDYAEGWSLIWEYLWHAEQALLIILILGSLLVLIPSAKPTSHTSLPRVWGRWAKLGEGQWLIMWAGLYALMALVSTGLELFVMYDRLARQLTPLMCLAAAAGFSRFIHHRRTYNAAVILVGLLAFTSLIRPLTVQYPYQVVSRVVAEYGPVRREYTADRMSFEYEYPNSDDQDSDYTLFNAGYFFPLNEAHPLPDRTFIQRWDHPYLYRPYQYNGYTKRERQVIQDAHLSMALTLTESD